MSMKRITVEITKEQKEFLNLIQFEDAAGNQSEAIQWCIDACIKIEKLYGIDACYVAHNDVRIEQIATSNTTPPRADVDWSRLEAIAPPEKWIGMYQEYQEMLTKEDVAGWYAEQFNIANKERNELKALGHVVFADIYNKVYDAIPDTLPMLDRVSITDTITAYLRTLPSEVVEWDEAKERAYDYANEEAPNFQSDGWAIDHHASYIEYLETNYKLIKKNV